MDNTQHSNTWNKTEEQACLQVKQKVLEINLLDIAMVHATRWEHKVNMKTHSLGKLNEDQIIKPAQPLKSYAIS